MIAPVCGVADGISACAELRVADGPTTHLIRQATVQYAAGAGGTRNTWTTLCTFTTTRAGVYPLRVRSAITGATNERGYASASYSVRATLGGAGPQPRVYGIGDMSLVTQAGGDATYYLAEVNQDHAGKTLEIELFDPGSKRIFRPRSESAK